MRNKIVLFVILLILGVVITQKNLFTSKAVTASYNLHNISEIKDYEINGDGSIMPKEQPLLIIKMDADDIEYGNLKFSSPIPDELTLTVELHNNENESISVSKSLRKGLTEYSFDFPKGDYIQVDLNISNKDKSSFGLESVNFGIKGTDIFQKDAVWFAKIFILFTICGIVTIILDGIMNKKRKKEIDIISNTRSSNIELLRILCMITIIGHHMILHGGAVNMELSASKSFVAFLLPLGKIGFTCFLAISTWFLVDSKFKTSRFLKIWFQVFFYSTIFTCISLLVTKEFTITKLITSMLPISGTSHGFASSYLLLYLMLPFLNIATKNLTKFQARFTLGILFYAQVIAQIIGKVSGFDQPIFSEFLLFIMVYMLSFNLKRYPIKMIKDKKISLFVFLGIWLILVQISILNFNGIPDTYLNWIQFITEDESSITYIIAGYALFFFFNNLNIKNRKSINIIATTIFGVLLIHDHFYLRNILWNNILKCSQWYYIDYFPLICIALMVLLFTVFACFDYVRKVFIEEPLFHNRKLNEVFNRMDANLNENNK